LSKAAAVFTNPKPVEGWVGQYDTPDRAVTFESDRHLHFLPLATSARAAIGRRGVDVIRIDAGVIHEFQSAGFAPWRRCNAANRVRVIIRLTEEEIRKNMMMNIDHGRHATSA
jgi:hypothetical protein